MVYQQCAESSWPRVDVNASISNSREGNHYLTHCIFGMKTAILWNATHIDTRNKLCCQKIENYFFQTKSSINGRSWLALLMVRECCCNICSIPEAYVIHNMLVQTHAHAHKQMCVFLCVLLLWALVIHIHVKVKATQYPVWTAQSALHFCPSRKTCSFQHQLGFSGKHSSHAAITRKN